MTFVFDFEGGTDETRALAGRFSTAGHDVHFIVSTGTKLVEDLMRLKAKAYWSAHWPHVEAARNAGISACWVGHEPVTCTTLVMVERLQWDLKIEGA